MMDGTFKSASVRVRGEESAESTRVLVEESAIAVVHDATTYAVMMATPCDLEDFAIGLSLNEGVISSPDEVRGVEVVETAAGVEVRLWLPPGRSVDLARRRRTLVGPTGCGLCGVESLEQSLHRPTGALAPVEPLTLSQVYDAVNALEPHQALGRATRAAHAAGFWKPDRGLVMVREDVGRHNALDKLVGGLARAAEPPAGVLVMTSRISVELVQKASQFGFPVLAAMSAPTALAVREAAERGLTVIGVVRSDGFEIFTHPERIRLNAGS